MVNVLVALSEEQNSVQCTLFQHHKTADTPVPGHTISSSVLFKQIHMYTHKIIICKKKKKYFVLSVLALHQESTSEYLRFNSVPKFVSHHSCRAASSLLQL